MAKQRYCKSCGRALTGKWQILFCSKKCAAAEHVTEKAKARRRQQILPPPVRGARWLPLGEVFALVDADDFDRLNRFVWMYNTHYAYRKDADRIVLLHREILGLRDSDDIEGDHKNCDGLDCRKRNLRLATVQEGKRNRRSFGKGSRFKGVSFTRAYKTPTWRAQIMVEGRPLHLGMFKSEEAAARAYDDAARRHFGEFARLNFPRPGEQSALKEERS